VGPVYCSNFLPLMAFVRYLDKLTAFTDVGDEVLETCRRNVDANKHLRHFPSDSVFVRELDWLQSDLQTGS